MLAGDNETVFRYALVAVLLLVVWTHWRAAYTGEVRAALDDPVAGEERLEDLIPDLRDNRLAHRCKAILADRRAADVEALGEHVNDVLDRLGHLERFAPLRRLIPPTPEPFPRGGPGRPR
jgi:hypothetical protein